ncbi:MAG: tryptophan--tRNA ligase [candidate division WOR-3 bacterium]|nr:tryptophan--tRNA ligase [candidate division WOR-3 bacterium]
MERILSGLRPTGRVHIGNYFGALKNWVSLQDSYETLYEIADWHTLTTKFEDTEDLKDRIINTAIDWVSVGIDPEKSVLFVQSDVKEHAELHLLLSMLITVPRLERNPTLKEMIRDADLKGQISYGLLGYPVLQASDVLIYRPRKVPVGEDQLPHLEITRELARRFNYLYKEVFPEVEPVLTETPRIPGLDGRRMSKSVGNAIYLSDSKEVVREKLLTAYTDPEKIKKDDPGHPGGCVVFAYLSAIGVSNLKELERECKKGGRGCVKCKRETASLLNEFLDPIREKREKIKKKDILEILKEGAEKAGFEAKKTMALVRNAMKLR